MPVFLCVSVCLSVSMNSMFSCVSVMYARVWVILLTSLLIAEYLCLSVHVSVCLSVCISMSVCSMSFLFPLSPLFCC